MNYLTEDKFKAVAEELSCKENFAWLKVDEEAIVEVLRKHASQDGWVSVEDRLPEERTLVNVAYPDGSVRIYSWFQWETMARPVWFAEADGNRVPTHWMPLPTPPAKEGKA